MQDSFLSLSTGYTMLNLVVTLTPLALAMLFFVQASAGQKAHVAMTLIITAFGLGTGFLYLFNFLPGMGGVLGYCFFSGLAAIICTFFRSPYNIGLPFIFASSLGCAGMIGWFIGAFLMGSLVCPFLWLSCIFWIFSNLGGCNIFIKIVLRLIFICAPITVIADPPINITKNVINSTIIKRVCRHISKSYTTIAPLVQSDMLVAGDAGSKTYSSVEAFGSASNLPDLIMNADKCSATQFILIPSVGDSAAAPYGGNAGVTKTQWQIRAWDTGDNGARCYISSGFGGFAYTELTDAPVSISGSASLEIRGQDGAVIGSLRFTEIPRKQQAGF